jgi:hypothetical protein
VASVSGVDGCLDAGIDEGYITKSQYKCEVCKKCIRFAFSRPRITAMLNEPDENAWMAFVYHDVTSPRLRMFEGSHRCHTRSPNLCINDEHVFLETGDTNKKRDLHQRAREPCDHDDLPCLGVGTPVLPRMPAEQRNNNPRPHPHGNRKPRAEAPEPPVSRPRRGTLPWLVGRAPEPRNPEMMTPNEYRLSKLRPHEQPHNYVPK